MGPEGAHSLKTRIIGGAASGLAYYAASMIFIPLISGTATAPPWVPSGIAAAASVVFGLWVLPFVWLGSFASMLSITEVVPAAMMATVAVVEVLVFQWLLRRVWRSGAALSSFGSTLGIAGAMIGAPLVSALLRVIVMTAAGVIAQSPAVAFIGWWLSEIAGIGAVAGIAILWNVPLRQKPRLERVEAASAMIITIVAAGVLYWVAFPAAVERAVPFLFLPLFTWIAFRCEARSMAVTVAVVSVISTIATLAGHGPFAAAALDDSLLALDLVISVFAFSSIALALMVADNRRALSALESARAELERKVEERTAELRITNKALLSEIDERTRTQAAVEDTVRERTTELRRAYREVETASAAKDQFLANMIHELRTPLNSIIGFSDMLLAGLVGDIDAEQTRQVGMINNSGRHLLSLVNDVLDLSRIESGRVRVELEEFDLREAVDAVIEAVRPMAEEKGLSLELDLEGPDALITTDRRKASQILLNLVGNAIKFTDDGTVVLRVSSNHRNGVSFSVSDTGVGIPEGDLGHVFEEFHQLASADAARPEGTGLGLAISLRLARVLGGELAATSEVGVGSTFTFWLPSVVRVEQPT
jgi:signal transduction histidine kinase